MITKAIIPVAGMGTRFLPAAKSIPKEMFPLLDKPVIHYIVEEAVKSGITDIIFVTSAHKKAVEDYFDAHFELEYRLEQKGRHEINCELQIILTRTLNWNTGLNKKADMKLTANCAPSGKWRVFILSASRLL